MMGRVYPQFGNFATLVMLMGVVAGLTMVTGCTTGEDSGLSAAMSRPTASRPPWAFPKNTSEDEIIHELREHVASLARSHPNESVLAYVFFKSPQPFSTYDLLVQDYGASGGDHGSVQALQPFQSSTVSVIALDLPKPISDSAALLDRFDHEMRIYEDLDGGTRGAADLTIGSMAVWIRAKDADKFWNDHSDDVRGIGIEGASGHIVGLWPVIKPGEPLR